MKEFFEITAKLWNESLLDENCGFNKLEGECCECCPYERECITNTLFLGCPCWQLAMNEVPE